MDVLVNRVSEKIKKVFSNKYNLYLVLLIIFHILFFITFNIADKNYQTWDSAGHISISFRMAYELKRIFTRAEGSSIITLLKISNYYPPLIQLIGGVYSLVFGYNSNSILIISLVFFIISIVYTYKLALLLSKNNRDVALLSAISYSFFPQVIDQTHYFHLDIPLVALVLIATYYLLTSDNFSNLKKTILFFVFFALAQITKWYAFVFILTPVFICLYRGYKAGQLKKRIINLLIGSVVFSVIAFPWYILNWNELIALVGVFSVGESDDPTTFLTKVLYYPENSLAYQILFLPMILLLGGLVAPFFEKDTEKTWKKILKLQELFYILFPLAIFIYISNKNLRYILPLAPLFAFIIADFSIKLTKKFKNFFVYPVLYLILGTVFLSFNQMTTESVGIKPISLFFAGPKYKTWSMYNPTFYSYSPNYYPVKEILLFIKDDAQKPENTPLGVAVLIDSEEISAATLEMVRLENHLDSMYMPVPYFQFEPFESSEAIKQFFIESNAEYVIAPKYPGPEGLRNYAALKQTVDYLASNENNIFENIKTFEVPNGNTITIYKRIGVTTKVEIFEGCINNAGFADGIESIKLQPDNTYVFYTGHFAIQDKIWKDYESGVLYIVEIRNTIHESILDVHNLPKSGSTLCRHAEPDINFENDIKLALTEENRCGEGINCKKVVHVQWNVGDEDVKMTEYDSADVVSVFSAE